MLGKFFDLFKPKIQTDSEEFLCNQTAPQWVEIESVAPLHLSECVIQKNGPAMLDWQQVYYWLDNTVPEKHQADAWLKCVRGWLLHLRDSLAGNYELLENEQAFVLSPLERRKAVLAMEFIGRTRKRILHILKKIAANDIGKDILVICADVKDYFAYIAAYYPDREKDIARSSGVYLHAGCGHFVTMDADLLLMEPVIVHELTHSYVSHLPLPTWLNEGIAMNVEHRLVGRFPAEMTAQEMYEKHREHWSEKTIQTFWSGEAFRTQDTMTIAYDLATTMVMQLAKDWDIFTQFVLTAHYNDAGLLAAQEYVNVNIGEYVCLMLDKAYAPEWEPDSTKWI